jgi:hypothetical protein
MTPESERQWRELLALSEKAHTMNEKRGTEYRVSAGIVSDALRDLLAEVERLRGDLARCREVQKATAEGWRHEVAEVAAIVGAPAHTAELAACVRAEVERLRYERRMFRRRIAECLPWVGKIPYPNTPGFSEMIACRDLAKDALEEVPE